MTSSSCHLHDKEHLQSPLPKSSRLLRFFIAGLFTTIIIILLPLVTDSCISLLKPVAVSILQRLWNVFRFLLITTVISLSILNTQRSTKEIKSGSRTGDDEHRYSRASSLGDMGAIFIGTVQQTGADQMSESDHLVNEKPRRISSFCVREASHQEFACNADQPRENHRTARPASAKRPAEATVQVEFQAKKLMISERTSSVSTFRSCGHRLHDDKLKQVETPRSRGNKEAATTNRFAMSSRYSRSALNLHQFDDSRKISKRNSGKNTSLSCDFGDDYSPEWLFAYPPPLQPPPDADSSSDSELEKAPPSPKATAQITASSSSSSSSSSLAALRSSPVDIARSSNPSVKQAPPLPVEEGISPSPGELNRKADAFIARFHEQMRMQMLESYEKNQKW